MSLEEDIKLLREEGGPRSHVMSWKYFTGDITSRAVHLYRYPDVSSNQIITLNYIKVRLNWIKEQEVISLAYSILF